MSDTWFDSVSPDKPLTQGDLISSCPVLVWKNKPVSDETNVVQSLKGSTDAVVTDVVVMTQACDLQQHNVENIILCPSYLLVDYKAAWTAKREARGITSNKKDYQKWCNSVKAGRTWNLTLLNHSGTKDDPMNDHRVVNFHQVYTAPRAFLESFIRSEGQSRLRLRSPYREHLSQSFARFFMRVGLPLDISDIPDAK